MAIQIVFLANHEVRTSSDAVYFGLISALGPLATRFCVMFLRIFTNNGEGRS
jgi:hypothetical protein